MDYLIPKDKMLNGVNLALQHSVSLLNASGELFNNKKYSASIPLAILSYEESAKARWFLKNLQENTGITKKSWNSLIRHDFKLVELEKENLEMIDNMSKAELKIYLDFQREKTKSIAEKSKEDAINKRKDLLGILNKFEKIKENCLYSNWNQTEKKWNSIHMFSEDDQFALSYAILNLAENLFLRVVFFKDLFENPSKSSGIKEIIPDIEKNQIIELEDHEKDMEKRKSIQDLNLHFEKTKKTEPILAKGWDILRKKF